MTTDSKNKEFLGMLLSLSALAGLKNAGYLICLANLTAQNKDDSAFQIKFYDHIQPAGGATNMFKRCMPAVEHVYHHGAPDGSALRHSQSAVTPPARTTSRFPTPPQRMSTTSKTPGITVSPWAKKTTLLCPK